MSRIVEWVGTQKNHQHPIINYYKSKKHSTVEKTYWKCYLGAKKIVSCNVSAHSVLGEIVYVSQFLEAIGHVLKLNVE